jgi:hypothetical protein
MREFCPQFQSSLSFAKREASERIQRRGCFFSIKAGAISAGHRRARPTWRQVAAGIEAAAGGGDMEGAAIALRLVLVLMLEGVECRPQ